ncbi:signal recognition particle-docking protein FtsY [Candidatus Tisiphia endosymbiont of Nemotelus uliginosus]|uniref:signal recognition particle-docking protein FtsY n=1 Tax=Candidatus Tisiphia endosymbiont of Nemotelus uliginosus TaxID=3077926 RepID=UPI0035C9176A
MISLFSKLKQALVKSSDKIASGIDKIFYKKKLDEQTLDELEELLISSDITHSVATAIVGKLRSIKFDPETSSAIIKEKLAEIIVNMLDQQHEFELLPTKLNVILVCGVNGSGKTTTIGKLATSYSQQGKKVAIAACDTFRAAAVSQLASWATKSGAVFITGEELADPASVAYLAIQSALKNDIDVLFIDTAGRLHNHKNLMDELGKIIRVIKKVDQTAPHHNILIIDATTGQNIYNQIEQFKAVANITGLIVTKLDGTAKAGVVVGAVQKFGLPIYFIGIGEGIEDLKPFNPVLFANSLVGNN